MTGEELKERILLAKVSQKKIAEGLGMAQSTLASMLTSTDVKSGIIEKIAAYLGVSVADIYAGGSTLYDAACAARDSEVSVTNIVQSHVVKDIENSQVINGDGSTIKTNDAVVQALLKELAAQRAQNERLLNMLEGKK